MSKQSKLCEACSQPMPDGAVATRVGACEFPFYVHEQCRESMQSVAGFVEELCELAEHQPEGLLWLGSWSSDTGPSDSKKEESIERS